MPEETSSPRTAFRSHFNNWLSWAGLVLAGSALFAFVLLFAIDQLSGHRNPYVGILGDVVAPGFFILGIGLAVFGAFIHWRRIRRASHEAIRIDLSRPRDRRILTLFAIGSAVFLLVTAVGSYETYHYTESVEFCGKACHVPMEPQFVAAQHVAHANVDCVACHVGPGVAAYFRTKVNGTKQLYHTILNDYPRPIYVSEANPRPPQMICEQCHWPKRHIGNVVRTFQHYLSDEKNTPMAIRMMIPVGGGDTTNGPEGGIHWHMNIANKVEYIATDDLRTSIPWVRLTNAQGVVTEYRDPEFKDDPGQHRIQRMECTDCHSRPAHKINTPNEAVDSALSTGRIDPNIPWVKSKVVAALVQPYKTKQEAEEGIARSLHAAYPDPGQADRIIAETQTIYRANFFPEVKTDWRTHPNFIGHKDWNGCFRCHDGKHVSSDGKAQIKASDCNSCHTIVAQGSGDAINQIDVKGQNFIHIDSEYSDFNCAECHTGGPQQ